ncbi:hypothetical protein [Streptomyces sp. NRRL WC-3742]|uniref:hypothetical protein n=1 Tax=Streptomyces sp. NRRL WC-3742 TaxID=1463934 RepID=UPI00068B4B16|nr:hypothetical protein [Streptomyces sp. NRRL WC-3742]
MTAGTLSPTRVRPLWQRATPLAGPVEVTAADGPRTAVRFTVAAGETVLPGHYPGFPIFPGVCLLDLAHAGVLATAPAGAGPLELAEVESTRFTSPVYPGDVLDVDLDWRAAEGGWKVRGAIRSARGDVAKLRLRYRGEVSG